MSQPAPSVPFAEAARVWARIGILSFGGPAAQIALMHRVLVDEQKWVGEAQFLHALNFCMLLPGPEAQQLATYVGWLLHGVRGGLVAGLLFILPGMLLMLGLSVLYVTLGQVPAVAGLLFGLKAAVLVIVVEALERVGSRALGSGIARLLAVLAFAALFLFGVPFPVVVLAAGLIGYVAGRRGSTVFARAPGDAALDETPRRSAPLAILGIAALWLAPLALLWLVLPGGVYAEIARFFSWLAVITFGGAYAVLSYMTDVVVGSFGWLRPHEMMDALGLAETTPGPLILVTQFVGFVAAWRENGGSVGAGILGALLTTWVTFAPCFLWIFVGAPYVERLRGNRALASALAAITAAVVGVIANLGVWFGVHFLFARTVRLDAGPFDAALPDWASLDAAALVLTVLLGVIAWRWRIGIGRLLLIGIALGLAVRAVL
ncbi:chromate efflux transporter [Sphingosinicella microcystinivorans]|nr:chromate efflux transporter [Sphingosinicella microcystinivorans]WBX82441.1 chromate efflux transporter [Sphingosinicella microcystinivorans]